MTLSIVISSGVYLCGSSAGGHLAAMMLAQDWLAECMISPSLIKGEQLGACNFLCNGKHCGSSK